MILKTPPLRVIDLSTQLGLYALGQLGVADPSGYGLWPQLRLGDVATAPGLDWHRPYSAKDLVLPSPTPAAVVLIVGPGSVALLRTTLQLLEGQAPRSLWVFVMPSALMEEAALRASTPPALAHAEVYVLPDSRPHTFWFILMEQLNKLSAISGQDFFQDRSLLPADPDMSSNLKQSISAAMTINGALAAALVDYRSGMCLAQAGTVLNLELAAAGNTEVVRAKLKTIESLGLRRGIEDILITLVDQYHLIRLIPNADGLFLYLVLDKEKGNLALARFKLTEIERGLRV